MSEKPQQPVYFCKISAPSKGIGDECEFFALRKHIETKFSLTAIDEFGGIDKQECIVIAFAKMEDLQDKKTYLDIVDKEKGLRRISSYKGDSAPAYCPHPIILIGMEDIMQDQCPENREDNSHNILKILNLDPRFRFWDSSIWHRYVPLNEDFKTNFCEALEEIGGYFEQRLYTTNVSLEFLEFQTRMLVNSYLASIGEGGHATDVTPYKFHSETAMKVKADKELNKIKSDGENLRWRFLLIDDYAKARLRPCNSNNESKTKQEIIESVLKEKVGNIEICSSDENIGEPAVNLIDWAFEKLEKNMYDIILLDYLLGENKKVKREDKREDREFGSEFLEVLDKIFDEKKDSNLGYSREEKIKKSKGPLGRFWIFPISVFSSAMLDEIHQQGTGHISEHWYLAAGADPVNTPQLFRYNLYRFMNLQIKTAPKDLSKFMKCSFEDTEEAVSKAARSCYPYFIKLRSEYDILRNDVNQDSSFAQAIQNKRRKEVPHAVWEHLTHLIYLLAYGSRIEWPEMWEEYNHLKQYFDKDGPEFMDKIRAYIIELKS